MARKISISFKETSKDLSLYNYLMGLDDKSSEIKSILRQAIKLDDKKVIKEKGENKDIDILNF